MDVPFSIEVYATDNAFNVASTATATVQVTTTGFTTDNQPFVNGVALFSGMMFASSGTQRAVFASAPGAATVQSSLINVYEPTSSSPTVSISIGNNTIQTTLGGAISGTAADSVGVVEVVVSLRRLSDGLFNTFGSGFTSAGAVEANATLDDPGAMFTSWDIGVADTELTNNTSYYLRVEASNSSDNLGVAEATFTFNAGSLGSGSSGPAV
jgi:hypothetical protein